MIPIVEEVNPQHVSSLSYLGYANMSEVVKPELVKHLNVDSALSEEQSVRSGHLASSDRIACRSQSESLLLEHGRPLINCFTISYSVPNF